MDKFNEALDFTLKWEGGYVNDPDDPGGETNMGITAGTLKRARDRGFNLPKSVKDLTKANATLIYFELYWKPYAFDSLPVPACTVLFDITVNHGAGGMAKMAQRVANALNWNLAEDGKYGPKTAQSINVIGNADPKNYAQALIIARINFYNDIIRRKPSQVKYKNGWFKRTRQLAVLAGVKCPV